MADTSFISIPKPPQPRYRKGGMGLFVMLAVLIFAVSLALYGAVFLYKQLLDRQKATTEDSLKKLEADFEPSLLMELNKTSVILGAARTLLAGHIATSRIFKFIEENVLDEVRFANFAYSGDTHVLKMNGQAHSYTALAQQAAIFESSQFVENVFLSNLSLGSKGDVDFSMAISFKPNIVQFQ